MTQTIEQLTSRVRELEEENARLKAECDDIKQIQFPRKLEAVAAGWKKQLAASQAYAEQLRKLVIDNCMHADTCDSLSLDDEGEHMACSCGLTAAIASVKGEEVQP